MYISTFFVCFYSGPYFGYTYAPSYAQQLAAAGLPYAMTAAPTAGSANGGQPQPGQPDSRIQWGGGGGEEEEQFITAETEPSGRKQAAVFF